MILVDTHCHLQMKAFRHDIEKVIDNACQIGVQAIINVGFDMRSSEAAVQLSEKYPSLYAAVGIHPHDAKTCDGTTLKVMEDFFSCKRVVAVGEIGLDYYRDLSPRAAQRHAFAEQLQIARECGLPVILHVREAYEEVFAMLDDGRPEKGVFHCFSGTAAEVRRALKLGYHISFGGSITYGRKPVEHAVRQVPLDRLMIETDAPYLSPVPHRGKRNEPAFIRHTAERLAELREESLQTIARVSTENACSFFRMRLNG